LDPGLLPYRSKFVQYLQEQRAQGRCLVLATASDQRIAKEVAGHLGIFDAVLASDGNTNLVGERKRERLVNQFGTRGFDYAGNDSLDLKVWSSARKALLVSSKPRLARAVANLAPIQDIFEARRPGLSDYFNSLRPQQWLKNLLVFVVLCAAHRFYEPALWGKAIIVFIAFCCCASSGYLVNELFDLSADRHHPTKRLRPFAAGRIPVSYALTMIPILIVLGCLLGLAVSRLVVGILLLYYVLTLMYSVYLKRVPLLDVVVLAGLYTLRIVAGAVAVSIPLSGWLLAFSMFLFISLAFVKRYSELMVMRSVEGDHAKARGYENSDAELLASKGTASGYIAVLVLALYIMSGTAKALYGRHEVIWFLCPLLLYWVGYLWLVAHRGTMHDDPFVFALRDRTSRILVLLMIATALLAV